MSNRQRLKSWHKQWRKIELEIKKPKGKAGDAEFYRSRDWRELRYKVLKRYGRTCMCCGARGGNVHVDHIKPRARFPALALVFDNLQVLCEDCNLGKGAWDQTDWRQAANIVPKPVKAPRT